MEDWLDRALERGVPIDAATAQFDGIFGQHRSAAVDVTMHARIRQLVRAAIHSEYP
jgi:hypothetical protein